MTTNELSIPIVLGIAASIVVMLLALLGLLTTPLFFGIVIAAGLASVRLILLQAELDAAGSHEDVWTHLRRTTARGPDEPTPL